MAHQLTRVYPVRVGLLRRPVPLRAVSDVSFVLQPARILAVVGESGCGKSTLARMVTLLERPTSGAITLDDKPAAVSDGATRRAVQMVFQDPYGSLNPRRTVAGILEEPLTIAGTPPAERREAALAMMARVGLRHDQAGRYPHMFSGGQRQRVAIARALMLRPRIVVVDEPVSALDVSIRAQVLNLLLDLRDEFRQAYLFISHDLSVVRHMADEVVVMYFGRVVEHAPRAVFSTGRAIPTRAPCSPRRRACGASRISRDRCPASRPHRSHRCPAAPIIRAARTRRRSAARIGPYCAWCRLLRWHAITPRT